MKHLLLAVILFCFVVPFLFSGCFRDKSEGAALPQEEVLVRTLEDSLSKSPVEVEAAVDSLLLLADDSLFYYRLLVVKLRARFLSSDIAASIGLVNRIKAYCDRHADEGADIKRLYARLYNMSGNIYSRKAVMDSSLWAFGKAYAYTAESDYDNLPDVCLNLADANVWNGRYDSAAFWYRQALLEFDARQVSEEERFPAYYGLAQVNMELRDFRLCDYYYDLAARSYNHMKPYEKHVYLNNRGNSYYFRQDYDTALKYFRRSLALCNSRPEMEFERNLTMVNLGEVFLLMHRLDSASYYLMRCYDFFHSINNNSALYYIDTQLIELALEQGDLALASRRLREAVKPDYIEPNMVHIRNRYLQHYYEKTGDFRRAYYYQQENQRIDDSTRSERIKMRSAEIALKYRQDSTLMKKEIFIREKENQVLRLHQWLYAVILGVLLLMAVTAALVLLFKRRRDREQWRMQTAMTSLRLENIRNRISPHFIFNVLNREVNLHRGETESRNLMGLIKLFRRNLEMTDSLSVTLAEELDFVETYIGLEESSLGESFVYTLEVDKTIRLEEVYVPSMLLQIPVENAIKHGLRLKEGKRLLRIGITRKEEKVEVVICDNGGGYHKTSINRGTGTGMKVITQTIQLLNSYNRNPIVMAIDNVPVGEEETGCEVRFVVPLHYSYQLKRKNSYGKDESNHH